MSSSKNEQEDFTPLADEQLDAAAGGRRITSVSVVPGIGGIGGMGGYGYPMGGAYASPYMYSPYAGAGMYSPYGAYGGFGMGAYGGYGGYGFGLPGYRLGTAL